MEIFKYICHRRKDRSFKIKNHYFPVCARCTGFYGALIIFSIISLLLNFQYNNDLRTINSVLIIPMAIDGITKYFNLRESNNT